MAGTTADRELSTRLAVATATDEAAIRRLLRDNPMRGAISLSFEREPDYFRAANLAGGDDQTIVAFADGQLMCMGRCTQRECWVNGAARRVGYLGELRLDETARGRFGILRDGYGFFHDLQRDDPAELYFTSIAADNDRARRLLERGARGLPRYHFLGELDTLLVAVPRRSSVTRLRVEVATQDRVPEMVRVLNAGRHQLAAVWTVERLHALAAHGLPLNRFLLGFDRNEVVACGALWDQRSFRQTVIRSYSRPLSIVRPLVNLTRGVFGIPRLPPVGSVLAHAFLSPLAFRIEAEATLPDFIEAFFPLASQIGIEFLTLALPTQDSRLPALRRRFSTRTYRSRLYRVDWPDLASVGFRATDGPFIPDVALL
jgi:hypothetical protein